MKIFNKFTNKNVGKPGVLRLWGGGGLPRWCLLLLISVGIENGAWAQWIPFPMLTSTSSFYDTSSGLGRAGARDADLGISPPIFWSGGLPGGNGAFGGIWCRSPNPLLVAKVGLGQLLPPEGASQMTEICRACGILTGTFFVLGCSGLAFARDDDSYTSLLDYFYGYWERWGAMNPDWGKVFANEREAPDRYLKGISIGALTTGLVGLSVLAVYHCFFAKPRCSITCCKLN